MAMRRFRNWSNTLLTHCFTSPPSPSPPNLRRGSGSGNHHYLAFSNPNPFRGVSVPFSHTHSTKIPPSKSCLYASFFYTLIHMFLTCSRYAKVVDAFTSMRSREIMPGLAKWNPLIHRFNASNLVSQVRVLYSEMIDRGVAPNVFTKNMVVHALCQLGDMDSVLELLWSDSDVDTVTYNMVMWRFCRVGLVRDSFGLCSAMVRSMISLDSFTCNILLKGFCDIGMVEYAEWVLENLVSGGISRDVIGLNILIDGYCKRGDVSRGLELMDVVGIKNAETTRSCNLRQHEITRELNEKK